MGRDGGERCAYFWIPVLAFAAAVLFYEGGGVKAFTGSDSPYAQMASARQPSILQSSVWQSSDQQTAGTAPRAALTFDDGPDPVWTPLLLDGLKERGVKATFFLMGEHIPGNEGLVKRMAEEGHLIGNHSYHHVQLTKENTEVAAQSFLKTSDLILSVTGERPEYARPPYGAWNEELEERTNLTTVLWNVDSLDWKYQNRRQTADKICHEVKDGDIILLHDIFKTSVQAALDTVDRLKGEGWEFVTVEELMVE